MVKRNELSNDDFKIPGQLGFRAVQILIKMQEMVSEKGAYNYVEIGSYKGRSLFPHVIDDDCKHALSIDLRPEFTPDERTPIDYYHHISAESMLATIGRHCDPKCLDKVETLTADSREIGTRKSDALFDMALIDGEHTNEAVFNDFLNLYGVMKEDCVICFDDTHIVFSGIANALAFLEREGRPHRALYLKGCITVVLIGEYALRERIRMPPRLYSSQDEMREMYRETLVRSHLIGYAAEYAAKDEEVKAALAEAVKAG